MASTKSGATSARNDVIDMLKDDHKRAKQAFKDFEKLDPESDADECEALVRQTCAELTVHATLEEECFYPAARQALEEADLLDEAEVEHQSAKDLIAKLEQMSAADDRFKATFTVLGEYIEHHVKEEEGEMFPQLARAKEMDWQALCDEMNSRRAELMEQLLPDAAAEDDSSEVHARPAASVARSGTRGGAEGSRPQAKKAPTERKR